MFQMHLQSCVGESRAHWAMGHFGPLAIHWSRAIGYSTASQPELKEEKHDCSICFLLRAHWLTGMTRSSLTNQRWGGNISGSRTFLLQVPVRLQRNTPLQWDFSNSRRSYYHPDWISERFGEVRCTPSHWPGVEHFFFHSQNKAKVKCIYFIINSFRAI